MLFLGLASCGGSGTDGEAVPEVDASAEAASCAAGQTTCGGKCVDTASDLANCGACGTACKTGEVCSAGACAVSCGGGTTVCGGLCKDTQVDVANCGACGKACATGEVCSAGTCGTSCTSGTTNCGGVCRDTKTDRLNCGACGTTCKDGEVCSDGACKTSCGGGLTDCTGVCRDTATDRLNCGACGTSCAAGEVCNAGKCALDCGAPLSKCGGASSGGDAGTDASSDASSDGGTTTGTAYCANLANDRFNCGTCGVACGAGKVCNAGVCEVTCGPGLVDCGDGKCRDLSSDRDKCGSTCGTAVACGAGKVCSGGACSTSCGGGLVDCGDGVCRDLSNDNGKCGSSCSTAVACASGKICASGACATTCAAGTVDCGDGKCRDLSTDNSKCGSSCTTAVACAAGQVCGGGTCGSTCAAGTVDCGDGKCRDLSSDNSKCGTSCGTAVACAAGKTCNAGVCTVTCGSGQINCGGACVDPSTNNSFCGATGDCAGTNAGTACASGTICTGGACKATCAAGQVACGGVCVDPKTNPDYCGASADCAGTNAGTKCAAGQFCTGGVCGGVVAASCRQLHLASPSLPSGNYMIDPDGLGPKPATSVYCDMTTDGGGYTWVKVTDAALLTDQAAYAAKCASLGMEVVVPRTKAHAMSMAKQLGELPNLVNVFPNFNGAFSLNSWHGTCQGAACTYWMSDDPGGNAHCMGFEPNGDNNTGNRIFRHADSSGCGSSIAAGVPGTWNDANNFVEIPGYAICSTNDFGPASGEVQTEAAASCKDIHAAYPTLPSGAYWIDPDGVAGAEAPFKVYCDMTTDGGGWTAVFKTSRGATSDNNTLWSSGAAVNETAADCSSPTTFGASAYCVNRIVTRYWNANGYTIGSARVHALTGGSIQAFMRFDGLTSDKLAWYSQGQLASSSWTDLKAGTPNFFGIAGDSTPTRNWFVNASYGGCPADTGWFIVSGASKPCTWESGQGSNTQILYSSATTASNWNTATTVGNAEVMMVLVK